MPATKSSPKAAAKLALCPLCDTPLDPKNPNECPRCDWVLGYRRHEAARKATERDKYAALLSVCPGLGHVYKGHATLGTTLMVGGGFAVLASCLAATATMGFGLLFIPWYWGGVMLHAFWLEDRRVPKS